MGKVNPKEEIERLLDKLETELTNLPFHDPTQTKSYKFGQYITAITRSIDGVNRTFRELKREVTYLFSLETKTSAIVDEAVEDN